MPFEGAVSRPIVCLDGTEGVEGRALMLVSVCHLAARRLRNCILRFVDVESPDVELAAEALSFDTGLDVQVLRREAEVDPFEGCALYAALAHRSVAHLRLAAAAAAGIPVLAAIQAAGLLDHADVLPPSIGNDTRAFAELLIARLDRIEAGRATCSP